MSRLGFAIVILGSAWALSSGQIQRPTPVAGSPFTVVEATIPQMQAAMEQHRISSREIVLA